MGKQAWSGRVLSLDSLPPGVSYMVEAQGETLRLVEWRRSTVSCGVPSWRLCGSLCVWRPLQGVDVPLQKDL